MLSVSGSLSALTTLERPKVTELNDRVLQLLNEQNPPDTVQAILDRMKEGDFVYKHEIARSVWRLANEGRIVVESGRIKARS
jgi:hypothetical protein